ncbi:hypothetical protein K488DRAFT_88985 [Vararia minispora EC-137]|uniref:Uncharacterized protein n=1 Tax=Vararia minispora EC-137 TaxID=1314806 RepID=A0ACB8QC50_9AGAM|nr:hypothetical protein K488DRAFT_88985 [Vararia minispora EC-137]
MAPSQDKDYDEFDKRITAEFHHARPGRYFPTPDRLREHPRLPRTVSEITERIADVKKSSARNLDDLFTNQAERYLEDALDRYVSYEDTQYCGAEDPAEWTPEERAQFAHIIEAHERPRTALTRRFEQEAEELALTDKMTANTLLMIKSDLKKGVDEDSRREMQAFLPQTVDEFRALPNGDLKKRAIARFLVAGRDSSTRVNIIMQPDYSWRGIYPLMEAYYSNSGFASEVQAFAGSIEVSDPRRRTSA